MNVYITKLNGMPLISAEQYAQQMVADIAHSIGVREMGIHRYYADDESAENRSRRLDGIIAGINWGDIVICQFPTWNGMGFERALVRHIKAYHGRIVIFIHDLEAMMSENRRSMLQDTVELYNEAELLIVPSYKMKRFLQEHGVQPGMKFIVQEVWDYTTQMNLTASRTLKREIHFAGNPDRFRFPYTWNYDVPLKIYSDQECQNDHVWKMGWIPTDRLLLELSGGGFGLVWYGDESWHQYLSMNNSLKLSTYLAAGIPVIAPRGISNQCMIEENNLGIIADTLEEVTAAVKSMTEQKYQEYTSAVAKFAPLLKEGFFTKKCLVDVVHMLMRKDMYTYAESNETYSMPDCAFEYVCLNESYERNLALSWVFRGEAEGFLVYDADTGKLVWEIRNGLEHYLLLKNYPQKVRFIVKAYIRAAKGKLVIAESDVAYVAVKHQTPSKVSLIMPAYNAEEYIARSIDTALAQSFADLEVIIVNDGSTDQTQRVIDWYQTRYPQIKSFSQSNGGQASARNTGIKYASGSFIGFMDNDDMLRPDMIERLYLSATKNECDVAITSVYQLIGETYGEIAVYPMAEDIAVTVDEFFEHYIRNLSPVIWNKLYRASLVKEHPCAVNVTFEDDAWTPYVLSYARRICYINAHLYEYDRRIRNTTGIHASWSKPIEEKFLDHKAFVMFFLENGNPEKGFLLKRLALSYMAAFMGSYSYPKYAELKEEIERATNCSILRNDE